MARYGPKTNATALLLAFLFSLSCPLDAGVASPVAKTRPACEGDQLNRSGWTQQEKWVWQQLCNGRRADLVAGTTGQSASSAEGPSWPKESLLTPGFLRGLFEGPFKKRLEETGIAVRGARLEESLDLSGIRFKRKVAFEESLFLGDVRLQDAVLEDSLSLSKSEVEGVLDISGAKIGRDLRLDEIVVAGNTRLVDLRAGRNLYLRLGAYDGIVDLVGLKVDGDLWLAGSTFEKPIDMSNIAVGRHLHAGRHWSRDGPIGTWFEGRVFLRNASIDGRLEMAGTQVAGALDMDAIRVGEDIFLRDCARIRGGTNLVFARIGQNLDLSGSRLGDLDATGAQISGELRLGSSRHPSPRWTTDAMLKLRNAKVFSWQDGQGDPKDHRAFVGDCYSKEAKNDPWPSRLEISGFAYQQLGGLGGGGKSEVLDPKRYDKLVKNWLERDKTYSPQPYEQLARIVRAAGYRDMANRILYDSKEKERKEAKGGYWLWLTTLKLIMGYGYRYSYALGWVVALVALGMIVLGVTGEGLRNKMPIGFFYSLDILLPIVRLRDYHHQVQLEGFARYYFYVHKLLGYFLASILIAGFSGLTR